MQSWPEFRKPAILSPSATASGSASSKTITGALPPSSRCTRLSVSAAAARDLLAGGDVAGQRHHATSGWRTIAGADGLAVAGDTTFSTPGGRISPASSARRSVESGVCSDGLGRPYVAGGQRRADLPDGHHQRVVPRRDLRRRARPARAGSSRCSPHVLAGRLALEHPRGAGEEAQVVGGDRHLVARARRAACRRSPTRARPAPRRGRRSRRPGQQRLGSLARSRVAPLRQRRSAASTARSTSACVPLGTSAMISPVAGFSTSIVPPSTASTHSPPTKFLCCETRHAHRNPSRSELLQPTTSAVAARRCPASAAGRASPGSIVSDDHEQDDDVDLRQLLAEADVAEDPDRQRVLRAGGERRDDHLVERQREREQRRRRRARSRSSAASRSGTSASRRRRGPSRPRPATPGVRRSRASTLL